MLTFSGEVTFPLTSGGQTETSTFSTPPCVHGDNVNTEREVWCAADSVEDLRNVCSSLASCYSLPSYRSAVRVVVQEHFSVGGDGRQGSLKWS